MSDERELTCLVKPNKEGVSELPAFAQQDEYITCSIAADRHCVLREPWPAAATVRLMHDAIAGSRQPLSA